jgi:hypothetical protein
VRHTARNIGDSSTPSALDSGHEEVSAEDGAAEAEVPDKGFWSVRTPSLPFLVSARIQNE